MLFHIPEDASLHYWQVHFGALRFSNTLVALSATAVILVAKRSMRVLQVWPYLLASVPADNFGALF